MVSEPKPFVNAPPMETLATIFEKGAVELKQRWRDFDPYPMAGTSGKFTVVLRARVRKLE